MVITDQWKLEWEKGIQVPNEKFIGRPNFCVNKNYLESEETEGLFCSKIFYSELLI